MVLAPAVGGLIVGPLVYFLAREAKGHGVPEVMDACKNQGGRIRSRVAAVKILASAVSIGTGGSVGREGPIVQIGSAVGSSAGQFFGLRGEHLTILVGCGAAAGIAATFNAPIAGVLFSIEIILGKGNVRIFSPLVVAAVIATVITRYHLGNFPAFEVAPYDLVSAWELPLYILLGALAAVAGVLLMIVGGVVVWNSSKPQPATPQVVGAPKLVVDQKEVDEGYLQYDVPVRTTFQLSNVGDQPLEILAAPVKLVDGC